MGLKRDISLRHKNSTELVNRLKLKRINHNKENQDPNKVRSGRLLKVSLKVKLSTMKSTIIDENVNLLDTTPESDSIVQGRHCTTARV